MPCLAHSEEPPHLLVLVTVPNDAGVVGPMQATSVLFLDDFTAKSVMQQCLDCLREIACMLREPECVKGPVDECAAIPINKGCPTFPLWAVEQRRDQQLQEQGGVESEP